MAVVSNAEVDAAQNACIDNGWPLPSRLAMHDALEAAARVRSAPVADSALLTELWRLAADSRVSSELIGIRVRNEYAVRAHEQERGR